MSFTLRKPLAVAAAIVAVFGLVAGGVHAQNNDGRVANGFRIAPVRAELEIEQGRSQTLTITIENPTDVATVARPVVNDFVASDKEDGEPRLILDENATPPRNSIKQLISGLENVPLEPRQKKDVDVTLRVPADARAGGYYGAVRYVPSDINQESNVGLAASVGTIVLVRVPGDLTERLDLVQLSAARNGNPGSFFTGGDLQVVTRVKNEGDIHLKPFGKVRVKNMLGKIVAEYELNNADPRANVLPDSIRKFTDDLPQQKWLGRYTIEANLGYSQGSGDLITARAAFWYMPIWSLLVLLVLVAGLIGGGYVLYRRYTLGRSKHVKKK